MAHTGAIDLSNQDLTKLLARWGFEQEEVSDIVLSERGEISGTAKYVGAQYVLKAADDPGKVIQCAASIICVDASGRILLGRRSDNHFWGYSGGAVEIDEPVELCAKRELLEEMGLTAETLEFFCVNSGPEAHYTYPNGDDGSNFKIVYLCRDWHGEPKAQDGEMDELRFFACEEIDLSTIMPPTRGVLEKYIREYSVVL